MNKGNTLSEQFFWNYNEDLVLALCFQEQMCRLISSTLMWMETGHFMWTASMAGVFCPGKRLKSEDSLGEEQGACPGLKKSTMLNTSHLSNQTLCKLHAQSCRVIHRCVRKNENAGEFFNVFAYSKTLLLDAPSMSLL